MTDEPPGPAGGAQAAGDGRRRIVVVPHTHWDREWYDPFQTFRMRLVETVDGLLDLLERDSAYRDFLLDGQLAVVDDYLEIRPEHEARLRALAAAGRLTVGPWYILMDEFLVSGETIVRNLQMGISRGAAFGGVMDVGYLPDMFGHIAQMPQLLRAAGLDQAVVWRGVPATVDRPAFAWRAPDGSTVRTEYLVAGYGNGAALPDDAKALVRRLDAHLDEIGAFLRPGEPLLLMNGTDHHKPQPHLGRVVEEANRLQDRYELAIGSLPDYLAVATGEDLPSWSGELRSGARSNLLMGVASNRVDVKQAAASAERSLEGAAEPLSALFLGPDEWPARFLEVAWTLMVRNSAHDSVCACSVDEVVDAVLHRYAEARQIGDGLAQAALTRLGASLEPAGPFVVNPTAADRSGMVELTLRADALDGAEVQVLSERAALPGSFTLDGATVREMLGMIQGARIDNDAYVTDVRLDEYDTGLEVTVVIGTEPKEGVPVEEVNRELFTRLTARPELPVRVTIDQPPARRVLARQATVPGFGWAPFDPAPLDHPVRVEGDPGAGPAGTPVTVANGLVTVVVDPADGTFSLDGVPGYGRLVDGGDHGDTYNYSPPLHDRIVDVPDRVEVTVDERGPVRATVTVTATYTWPERVDGPSTSRVGEVAATVTTAVEVRADEPLVRVTTRLVNPARDHRLRVQLPLRRPATTSRAECAFTVVERGLTAEGRSDELGLPTFPARRFVTAGGLTVVHDGLVEYELVDVGPDGARTLALTLLRSTGMLSRLGMTYRPFPAGPLTPIEGPQLLGPVVARYALATGEPDPYRTADDGLSPLLTGRSFGGGTRPARGSALVVDGAEVSAVRRQAGRLEVRVFNPTDAPTTVELPGRSGWLVDLRGRPLTPFETAFPLRPHGIATARLDDG